MTNEELVRNSWSIEELAMNLILHKTVGDEDIYITSDGSEFPTYHMAYDEELKWLKGKAEPQERTFKFKVDADWQPMSPACWSGCPFSFLIELGKSCRCLKGEYPCPFADDRYELE